MSTDLHPDEKDENGVLSDDTFAIEMEYSRSILCIFLTFYTDFF
jgi:hypothetical protein